jgi:hypothetical protein
MIVRSDISLLVFLRAVSKSFSESAWGGIGVDVERDLGNISPPLTI